MNYLLKGALASAGLLVSLFSAGAVAKDNVVEGTITISVADDFANKRSQMSYRLQDNHGRATEVKLDKKPEWLQSKQKVRVVGRMNQGKLEASADTISLLLDESGQTTSSSSTQSTTVSGLHSVLVAEVNFAVNPIVRFSTAQLHDALFNTAHQYFQESSYQQFGLTGQVLEPVTIDIPLTSCDTYAVSNAADQVIRQRGYEPSQYDHVMYVIPTHPKCTWSGKANVNGPLSWIKRFEADVIHHELGHNLGLYHAHSKDCDTQVTADSGCTVGDYGDFISGMGNARETNHFNGFQKEQLGWLAGQVQTVTSSQQVVLTPTETNDGGTKVAKVFKQTKSDGKNEWYYIEYRQAIGFDSHLADNYPQFLTGIRLREGTDNSPNASYLLDTTPETLSWTDISLQPGQTYHDSANKVSIRLLSSNASQATIQVDYGQAPAVCSHQQPLLEPVTPSSASVEAGASVEFIYKVTNRDNSDCAASSFNLDASFSSGLSGNFSQSQLSLAPGASQQVSLWVTAANNAAAGDYTFTATVTHGITGQASSHNGQVTVIETVTSTNQAPVANNDLVTLSSKSRVTIDVLSNDFDPEGQSLTIVGVGQGSKGSVVLNADNTLSYTPSKRFKNSDSFSYTISDGELTATATVTISLQADSESSKGGGSGGKGGGRNK